MSLIIRQAVPAAAASSPPPALAFDGQAQGFANGVTTLTVSHTVTTVSGYGFLLVTVTVVDPTFLEAIQILTVTHNGQAMTRLSGSRVLDSVGHFQETFYLVNPASGAKNIVVTTDIIGNVGLVSDSWEGVNQATPLGTLGKNSAGSGTNATAVAAGVTAGNVTRGCVTIFGGATNVAATPLGNNSNLTSVQSGASPSRFRHSSTSNQVDSGSVTAQWTLSASKPWTATAVEIKAA